jgi:hypothetical protein
VPTRCALAVRRRALAEPSVCSPASAALLLQVALVYCSRSWFKLRADEWPGSRRCTHAFAVEGVATGFRALAAPVPDLPRAAAAATLAIESLAVDAAVRALAHGRAARRDRGGGVGLHVARQSARRCGSGSCPR